MVTVQDFYKRWEDVESKLTNMAESPILSISSLAEEHLKELYQLKEELDVMQFDPNKEIKGIRTDIFGIVSFEDMENFAERHHIISSQKYLLDNGAIFSDAYMKKHGLKRSE